VKLHKSKFVSRIEIKAVCAEVTAWQRRASMLKDATTETLAKKQEQETFEEFKKRMDEKFQAIAKETREEEDKRRKKLNLFPAMQQIMPGIKLFGKYRLGQILNENVKCTVDHINNNPYLRKEMDNGTAEIFLQRSLTKDMWNAVAEQDLLLRSYDILRGLKPNFNLPEIDCRIIMHVDGHWGCLNKIARILMVVEDEASGAMHQIIQEAVISDSKRYEYIGRLFWDWGYQSIKSHLIVPYGEITFG